MMKFYVYLKYCMSKAYCSLSHFSIFDLILEKIYPLFIAADLSFAFCGPFDLDIHVKKNNW
jgi:hypothetical protein